MFTLRLFVVKVFTCGAGVHSDQSHDVVNDKLSNLHFSHKRHMPTWGCFESREYILETFFRLVLLFFFFLFSF